jgi:arylsulfatase A-like enzyme
VPLVVGGTTLPIGREHGVVSTLDIVPTILGITDTPAPPWLDGRDLREPPTFHRVVLVDTWHRRFDGALLFDQAGATDGEIAVVFDIGRNGWGLADLDDPTTMPDAATEDVAVLQTAVRTYLAAPPLRVAP